MARLMSESSAIVIGGGITGLVAAYRLQQRGAAVTLLEKSNRVGGCIQTVREDGFLMEEGPDVFLARKPAAAALCEELGLTIEETAVQPRRTYILRDGVLRALPGGFSGLVPTELAALLKTGLLTKSGKVRLLLDYIIPARRKETDESIATFYRRRIGSEAYEVLVAPLISGITGGNLEELSLPATFPQLKVAEQKYGGLLRMMARQPSGGTALYGIKGGMECLPKALEARISDIWLGSRATAVTRTEKDTYRVEISGRDALEANIVVNALSAHASSDILASLDPSLSSALSQIPYGSVGVVHVAYRADDVPVILDSYGYIIPSKERRTAVACTWCSSKFDGRAPRGYALFRLFFRSGLEGEGVTIRLQEWAKEELRATLGIVADPVLQRCKIWHRALPHYVLGHKSLLGKLQEQLKHTPGLKLCGTYTGGTGLPDRIRAGERAAEVWPLDNAQ